MTVWNEDEVRRFLKVAKEDPMFIVFHLALTTGMRMGEILGLPWKNVDLEKRLLYMNQTLGTDGKSILAGAKTKAGLRTINLDETTVKLLRKRKALVNKEKLLLGEGYNDHNLVACTGLGTPFHPSNVRRTFQRLIKDAEVPKIRFHDLRHTHATLLLSKHVNVKVISERLGHNNVKITLDTYSHVLPTMQKEVVKKINDIFN